MHSILHTSLKLSIAIGPGALTGIPAALAGGTDGVASDGKGVPWVLEAIVDEEKNRKFFRSSTGDK